jgi:hypothetical protein
LLEDAEVCETCATVLAAEGTNVPDGAAAKQELAAALASALDDGAAVLTVAFPAKEQLRESRLVTS